MSMDCVSGLVGFCWRQGCLLPVYSIAINKCCCDTVKYLRKKKIPLNKHSSLLCKPIHFPNESKWVERSNSVKTIEPTNSKQKKKHTAQ